MILVNPESKRPSVSTSASRPGSVIRIRGKCLVTLSYVLKLVVMGPGINYSNALPFSSPPMLTMS